MCRMVIAPPPAESDASAATTGAAAKRSQRRTAAAQRFMMCHSCEIDARCTVVLKLLLLPPRNHLPLLVREVAGPQLVE